MFKVYEDLANQRVCAGSADDIKGKNIEIERHEGDRDGTSRTTITL